jgi:hypothetical protein
VSICAKDLSKDERDAIEFLARKNDLIDERDLWMMVDLFVDDGIKTIQQRYWEIQKFPPITDAIRLPDDTMMLEWLRFNREYYQYLEQRSLWEPDRQEIIKVVMNECDQLYEVWDKAVEAKSHWRSIYDRRAALARFKELVGEEAYYTGNLPPYVPHWRFINR